MPTPMNQKPMRPLAVVMLLAASASGVADGIRTRGEQQPAELQLGALDPADYAFPKYVALHALVTSEDALPHDHIVESRDRVRHVPRQLVPLRAPPDSSADDTLVVMEVDDTHRGDGTLVLPFPEGSQHVVGWLSPPPPCWDDLNVPEGTLLLNHRAPPSDLDAAVVLTLLPLLLLGLMLSVDKRADAAFARTSVPPPGDFQMVQRGWVLGGTTGTLSLLGGAAILGVLCAARLLRVGEIGVSGFALSVVIPAAAVVMWSGYRSMIGEYAVCHDGISITDAFTGAVQWVRFSDVEGVDATVAEKSRASVLRLHLAHGKSLRLDATMGGEPVMRAIRKAVVDRLAPRAVAQWTAGETVDFGAVAVSPSALILNPGSSAKTISLVDVALVQLSKTSLSVKEKGALLRTGSVDRREVDEVPILLALLRHALANLNPSAVVDGD